MDAFSATDLEFLGLHIHDVDPATGDGIASFSLTNLLARMDGKLYGGSAMAVSVAAMEATTNRPALWATVQFVATASLGEVIECRTEVLAPGHRISQVRVTGRVGDRVVFSAVGATAIGKPNAAQGVFEKMPAVQRPDDCPSFDLRRLILDRVKEMGISPPPLDEGFQGKTRFRFAGGAPVPESGMAIGEEGGRLFLWAQVVGYPTTPALMGFLADFVPMSVVRGLGHLGGGTSLDNTLRYGPRQAPEWILLELDPHLAYAGYGHGTVHVWSPDGSLLATGSQTAKLMFMDGETTVPG